MKSVDEESLTNINELRKFRTEINQYLDKRENELLADIDQKKRTSKTLLDELKSKCTNMKSSIEKLKSELQAQDDNSNQLLIVGKRAIKELKGLQAALVEVSRRSEVTRYKFYRDPATEQLISSEKSIGGLDEGESWSALAQQQRQQQTKQEQRQQDTMQQHQKQMKGVSQKGESISAVGQQERQQQNKQQPRQLETMQQQQKHMQGVSQKARDFHRATLWMDMTLWRVMFRLSAVSIEFPDVYILYRLGIVVTINSAAPRLGKKTFDLLMTFPRGFR
ncbi:hypothetical protein MAR_012589 [Mya arenaria]|uniref:Uncharacterized protein n=1 Tax=Mya arenaria TaxID=6604 RepID=A0ABY7FXH8_MYAAR|nr:hypothetical protein MAR_012589 [Mya arenaria]